MRPVGLYRSDDAGESRSRGCTVSREVAEVVEVLLLELKQDPAHQFHGDSQVIRVLRSDAVEARTNHRYSVADRSQNRVEESVGT